MSVNFTKVCFSDSYVFDAFSMRNTHYSIIVALINRSCCYCSRCCCCKIRTIILLYVMLLLLMLLSWPNFDKTEHISWNMNNSLVAFIFFKWNSSLIQFYQLQDMFVNYDVTLQCITKDALLEQIYIIILILENISNISRARAQTHKHVYK